MKSVMDFFKGNKKDMPDDTKQKQINENPVNLQTRVMQVRDVTAKRKKILDEMDK